MKPTPRQLNYLKSLAERSGTTFAYPATKAQASREIERLKQRTPDTADQRRREREEITTDIAEASADAVRHTAEETAGHGATARWAHNTDPRPAVPANASATPQPAASRELARYRISAGERMIRGERINGKVALSDAPVDHAGRVHLIERHVTSTAELQAIVTDYITTSQRHDKPAMLAIPSADRDPHLDAA
jgi:hypothetical protein